MPPRALILASSSQIRLHLLQAAGVDVIAQAARLDEENILTALLAEGMLPHDIAGTLAEMKARKVAARHAESLVLGCDQILVIGKTVLSKPASPDDAIAQLQMLRNRTHFLFAAIVLFDHGQPIWRHIGRASMTMKDLSDNDIADYVQMHWTSIQHSVGCYKIEEAGAALFSATDGDITTIQGLPMPPLLQYLGERGFFP